ncbi:MAG: hypothetical protein KGL37_00660 [Acidobacteriota bacterium]|nr:hypothetical protein [Acidobacteriota bacterium]
MNRFRGIVLIAAGILALYEGWRIHTGSRMWLAFAVGLMAICLGAWRLTQKRPKPPEQRKDPPR